MDSFLEYMMQQDPTDAGATTQRAMADRLRGTSRIGALGSTSQIEEISKAGSGAMDQAFEIGKGMGLDKAKKRDEAEAMKRALVRDTTNDRILTARERDNISGLNADVEELEGFIASFNDDFSTTGGPGSEIISDLVRSGMTNFPRATQGIANTGLGEMLGIKKSGESEEATNRRLEDRSAWWSTYQRINTIPERAAIFGATMTPPEIKEWKDAEITERMTPRQIRDRLAIRSRIAQRLLEDAKRQYLALGMNKNYIDSLDANTSGAAGVGEAIMGQQGAATRSGTSEVADPRAVPAGVDPEEWAGLSTIDREDYVRLLGSQ